MASGYSLAELEEIKKQVLSEIREKKKSMGAILEPKRHRRIAEGVFEIKWVVSIYARGTENNKRKREIAYWKTKDEAIKHAKEIAEALEKLVMEG